MNRFKWFLLALFAFATLPFVAYADAPLTTLQGGAHAEYRFDYVGDGSPIDVLVTDTDPSKLSVSIYTSDQIEQVRSGQVVSPVGRGTPPRPDTLQWSGGFRIKGVYYVVVTNRAPLAVTYRMSITGSGASSIARARPAWTAATSQFVDEGDSRVLVVPLPASAVTTTLRLTMPAEPDACTHVSEIDGPLDHSVKLCPDEIYPPLTVAGDNVGLFSDDDRTSLITSHGREFALTVQGSNDWIEGVTIKASADPRDDGAWLCLYDTCDVVSDGITTTIGGGTLYGGGILLKGSDSTVHGVTVSGGTIGVATVDGHANNIIDNQLSGLNGWGSFNLASTQSYYVGNTWSNEDHGCTTADGRTFLHGCETSGWVCLGCVENVVTHNQCESSSNCFYMSGERNLASNYNSLLSNYCAGATANCFEITFSFGNVLQDNLATIDPATNLPCKYPFWIGGSVVYLKDNVWECTVGEDDAFNQSRDSTTVATNIIPIDTANEVLNAPKIILPTLTPTPGYSDTPGASDTPIATPTASQTAAGSPTDAAAP